MAGCDLYAVDAAIKPNIFRLTLHNHVILFLALRESFPLYGDDGERNDVYPAAQPHRHIASRDRLAMEQDRAWRWVEKIC